MDKKAICAVILGCEPADLMGFKDYGAFVAVLDPAGRKYQFTNEQLAAVATPEQVKEVVKVARGLQKEINEILVEPAKPAKKIEPKIKKTRGKASAGAGSLPKNPNNARKVVGK